MFWITLVANGVAFGMLLFLIGSGLSLIFGVMRVVNLAHGSYYLIGAYLGTGVAAATNSFLLGIAAGVVATMLLGVVMQTAFLERFGGQILAQVLLTMGFLLLLADLSLWVWGGTPQILAIPDALSGSVRAGGFVFPRYRLFISLLSALVALALYLVLERTRLGAQVRAAVDDPEMAQGLGVNVPRLSTAMFALGAALAGLAGVLGSPILGVFPGADLEILTLALAVVIIGGLGSFPGTLVGSLFVGLADNIGKALFPELSYIAFFAPMALILAVRPRGLFGR
ncbi:MAG: branched-chain amino acid ABC transporter permease [Armatimonadota bacterium]|nr:branched-chain amino acid ABC transporter permease [Armatimonadota bacterium]MDR7421035.1 branched-chain amino acid ABC transporter permease [Armatimonadota bacterium]MDR7453622.1 branched-chain amino acid ABC transporter permease [Armatimonadota bacterium]MDR7456826.1 branched-chain amino acid ABC transporter permease [Armatimonadota bacterium]MDR7495493.1 branched-chain amino acid ABC transporter permease [Armatimonadota bacterium]